MSEVKHTAPDSFVEQAMRLAEESAEAAWDAGKGEEYGAKFMELDIALRDSKQAELRALLTRQAARCAQLEEAATRVIASFDSGDCNLPRVDALAELRSALSAPKEQG